MSDALFIGWLCTNPQAEAWMGTRFWERPDGAEVEITMVLAPETVPVWLGCASVGPVVRFVRHGTPPTDPTVRAEMGVPRG